VFFWIPAGVHPVLRYGAGMTGFVVISDGVYILANNISLHLLWDFLTFSKKSQKVAKNFLTFLNHFISLIFKNGVYFNHKLAMGVFPRPLRIIHC
jgi:hypothetical protein